MKDKNLKYTGFYKNGLTLYELIGDKDQKQFIAYDYITKKSEVMRSISIGDMTYLPPTGNLISNDIIKLPKDLVSYSSEKALFETIKHFIYKYVDIPDEYLTISALYVLLTWLHDRFSVIPYLRVIGNSGNGKSRFLQVIGSICYKACFAGGATTVSPIFRIIELYKGVTLVLDEADFRFSGPDADIIKILNCGYMKGIPVLRTEGDAKGREPKGFDVYGPKIIATRRNFQDVALESRCLTQVMLGNPRKNIPIHLPENFEEEARDLRNQLLSFRFNKYFDTIIDESERIDNVDDRLNQIALPILSIFNDQEVKESIRNNFLIMQEKLNSFRCDDDPTLVLRALVEILKQDKIGSVLSYKNIAKKINYLVGIDSDYSYQIDPIKIGQLNKSTLNLETYLSNGRTLLKVSKNNIVRIQDLNLRYRVDTVDLVELLYSNKENSLDESSLDIVKQSLC